MSWVASLRGRGVDLVEGAELGSRTTYRVGGRARAAVEVGDEGELARLASALREIDEPVPLLVVGMGSNILVSDHGFDGLVVTLGRRNFARFEAGEDGLVTAGAALALPVLARRVSAAGLAGLAWGVGIPGTVGGAVRMNAGGHGSAIGEILERAFVADLAGGGGLVARGASELDLGYRRSAIGDSEVVVKAAFRLAAGDREELGRAIGEIVAWRREHQPGGQNAGSVFQNPPDRAAAKLIDEAGLKGFRWGSAQVSERHANFIQADSGGRADDVYALMQEVRAEISKRFGVELLLEVKLIGFSSVSSGEVA